MQLEALPFEAADQKTILQQAAEVAKGLRALLPKPKAKAKAESRSPGRQAGQGSEASLAEVQHSPGASLKRPAAAKADSAPKRRRSKCP